MDQQRPKKPKLTVKQSKFVKNVVDGKTKREAAKLAGYSGSPETLSVTASEVLKKPNVQEALTQALEKAGITMDLVVAPVSEALTHDDLDMRLKGHDRAMKIISPRGSEGTNVSINFNQHVSEKRAEYDI